MLETWENFKNTVNFKKFRLKLPCILFKLTYKMKAVDFYHNKIESL